MQHQRGVLVVETAFCTFRNGSAVDLVAGLMFFDALDVQCSGQGVLGIVVKSWSI
jgi:hypothetical protein